MLWQKEEWTKTIPDKTFHTKDPLTNQPPGQKPREQLRENLHWGLLLGFFVLGLLKNRGSEMRDVLLGGSRDVWQSVTGGRKWPKIAWRTLWTTPLWRNTRNRFTFNRRLLRITSKIANNCLVSISCCWSSANGDCALKWPDVRSGSRRRDVGSNVAFNYINEWAKDRCSVGFSPLNRCHHISLDRQGTLKRHLLSNVNGQSRVAVGTFWSKL